MKVRASFASVVHKEYWLYILAYKLKLLLLCRILENCRDIFCTIWYSGCSDYIFGQGSVSQINKKLTFICFCPVPYISSLHVSDIDHSVQKYSVLQAILFWTLKIFWLGSCKWHVGQNCMLFDLLPTKKTSQHGSFSSS